MRAGGIFPAIVGTLYLVAGAIVFALPIGLLAAIYLSEYAKDNLLTRLIKLAIVNLAGVPSVVYGLFGLALFVVFFKFGASILSGSLTLGIMILPVIITASREALESVPQSFREVSLSLGASKWQTIRHIVLPERDPGHPDRARSSGSAGRPARRPRSSSPSPRFTCRSCRSRYSIRRWPCRITCTSSRPRCRTSTRRSATARRSCCSRSCCS